MWADVAGRVHNRMKTGSELFFSPTLAEHEKNEAKH